MLNRFSEWLRNRIIERLNRETDPPGLPLSDFERLGDEIRPCDVLLVEGRSPVSNIIRTVTQTPWSHSAVYVGRAQDIDVPAVRARVEQFSRCAPDRQLVLEAILGKGTILTPLDKYHNYRVRLCRPGGITLQDRQRVIAFVVEHLGTDYDLRQLIDLARFMFPYGILPRRFRSTLFVHNAGPETRTVCSTLLAEAFQSVSFPILPVVLHSQTGRRKLYNRNTRLFTPRDFDISPYFDILKFPYQTFNEQAAYHQLPWGDHGLVCDDDGDCYVPATDNELETDRQEHVETSETLVSSKVSTR